jgi:prefoldin subunit 5
MTSEEMERAIEFLLGHQALLDQRIEQTNVQLGELSQRLNTYAEIQSEFIEIATRSIQALSASQERTDRVLAQLSAHQVDTDERLDRLTALIERFISSGRNGQE